MTKKFLLVLILLSSLVLLPLVNAVGENMADMTVFVNQGVPRMAYYPYNYATYSPSGGYGGASYIHILEGSNWAYGEIDSGGIMVSPGDRIEMGCYVKTDAFDATDYQAGAVFGFDFYVNSPEYGWGIATIRLTPDVLQAGHPSNDERGYPHPEAYGYTVNGSAGLNQTAGYVCKIPYNTDWTLIHYNFTVPTTTYSYQYHDGNKAITPTQISAMIVFMGIHDNGEAYFSQPYLYINPTSNAPLPTYAPETTYAPYTAPANTTINPLLILLGVAGMGFVLYEMAWKNGKK